LGVAKSRIERYRGARAVLRAERINVYPDTVQLVWFDSLSDTNNTVLPLYTVLSETNATTTRNHLCQASAPLFATRPRSFVSQNQGYAEQQPFGSAVDCIGGAIGEALRSIF
jgi:hypothetical protein